MTSEPLGDGTVKGSTMRFTNGAGQHAGCELLNFQSLRSATSPALIRGAAAPISVGMPVYNGEPYIAKALASILNQTWTDFNLYIADNCSDDGTEGICRAASRDDSRIIYVRREKNEGYIANHNRLAHEARGKFFVYTAADDEYRPQWLSHLAAALAQCPPAVLSFSAITEIDADSNPLGMWRNSLRTDCHDPAVRLRELFGKEHSFCQIFGLMRREVLLRTKLQPNLKSGDRMLLAELALHGPFAYVDEALLLRRRHEGQSSEVIDPRSFYPGRIFSLPNVNEGRWLLGTVARAPLTTREKLRSYSALRPWLRKNAVPMARNIVRAGIDLARFASRCSASDQKQET